MKPKINAKDQVMGLWKSINLCCVHIFHTMKWKYVQFSYCLSLIDSAVSKHGVGKCVCICLIDYLKLL